MKKNRRIVASIFWVVLGIGLNIACAVAKLDSFWSGLGSAFIFVGALQLIRWGRYFRSEAYREKVEVESHDERNRYLAGKAWAWAGYLFVMVCAVASIALRVAGQELLATCAGGAVCLILVLYWGSYFILRRKY